LLYNYIGRTALRVGKHDLEFFPKALKLRDKDLRSSKLLQQSGQFIRRVRFCCGDGITEKANNITVKSTIPKHYWRLFSISVC